MTTATTTDRSIGFIGAGQMARALASGFVAARLLDAGRLWAGDPHEAARDGFAAAVPGARVTADNREVAAAVDSLFLAVKPNHVATVLEDLRPVVGAQHLLVSICAGVPLAHIAAGLAEGVPLVRVMPNTPCLIGRSASAYCMGPGTTDADRDLIDRLLSAVGLALPLDEKLLDTVTGLAGSGPAFVYVLIEAMSDGGVLMGLPREVATALAVQTVLGSAELARQTRVHTATLRDRVTSPGGTTIAGLEALERGGLRAAVIAAVRAATQRSIELGEQYGKA